MFSLIGSIIIGFFAGLIAGWLAPGRAPSGCLLTIVVGIAGAVFATWAGRWMGLYSEGQNAGFLASIIGAVALLSLLRLVGNRN
ncbi:membrane protein [Polymorphobacter multimanifer]|uniref:Putative membrane protein YeaQ/YmgE (Transglycosylase-associated protein family) n=1 Tax=Polymorphobacter multimanifer TaxID=1070431 RepID=A0A841L4J3_9SPHN|nr:GlsB/YeaQ/YmgE family stress response membrane protein [Polymorphobacter multimanifer]MBB6226381.1 putative membrane protein YeaQ/YmgE (transglycosylase-associated protein family) [Polymorphobacter multimanifer]GGI84685.1 membrane protein [Polymorphobacter multimanifer]